MPSILRLRAYRAATDGSFQAVVKLGSIEEITTLISNLLQMGFFFVLENWNCMMIVPEERLIG